MKRLLVLLVTLVLAITLAGCTPPEGYGQEDPEPVLGSQCVPADNFTFYQATDQGLLGNKEVYYMVTIDGDVEIPNAVYDSAMLNEYEALCYRTIDGAVDKYYQARRATIVPEPIIIYEEVEVIVEVETIVHTHDIIDPTDWIATDHEVYYYFVQENIVNLVYTSAPTVEDNLSHMYLISIVFNSNTIFSDQVLVASVIHLNLGYYEGATILNTEFENTTFGTIDAFVEDYILTHTYEDVVNLYLGIIPEPPVEEE